jgi:hypothetical protein
MSNFEDLKVDWWLEARRPKTKRDRFIKRIAEMIFPVAWYFDQRRRKKIAMRARKTYIPWEGDE